MPAQPRARSFGLAPRLAHEQASPITQHSFFRNWNQGHRETRPGSSIRERPVGCYILRSPPVKMSSAISNTFSLARRVGSVRIARSSLIKSAHILERIGLAAVGASCGLYVGATLLRQKGGLFESGWIVLITMIYGALSYYVGIDLSGKVARNSSSSISEEWNGSEPAEIMSAAGTFGAAIAATLSVSILVLDQNLPNGLIGFVAGCWVVGSSLQVAAGTMARSQAAPTNEQ